MVNFQSLAGRAKHRRIHAHTEEAGVLAVGHAAIVNRVRQRHRARQHAYHRASILARAPNHRAYARPIRARGGPVATGILRRVPREIPVSTRTMAGRIVMRAAHDCPVFHRAGKTRQVFANANAGYGRGDFLKNAADVLRRVGLEVKRVQMTDASPTEKHDAILSAAEAISTLRSISAQGEQLGQSQSAQAQFQEITPIQIHLRL